MSEEIHKILAMDDRGIPEAHNAPARLFRTILYDLKIDRMTWDRLMRDFLTNPRSGVGQTPAKRSSERSNLNRALARPKVTWRKFRQALQVLNPKRIEYELEVTWAQDFIFPQEKPNTLSYSPQGLENELYMIWSLLMRDLGVTPQIWNRLVERYLDSPASKVSDNPPDRSTERGNLRKALFDKNELTWPTFCKGLGIVGIKEATLTVVLEWPRKTTHHSHHFKTGIGTRE